MTKQKYAIVVAVALMFSVALWTESIMLREIRTNVDDYGKAPDITIANNNLDRFHKPQITIVSSFLVGDQSSNSRVQDLDHLINKACYAKLWGYDFNFNMTYGFDKELDTYLNSNRGLIQKLGSSRSESQCSHP